MTQHNPTDNRTVAFAAIIISLALLVAASFQHLNTPPPLPANADASAFSAMRAMRHVHELARAPHPIGTPENAEVREYLIGQINALGFKAQIQTGTLFDSHENRIGNPHNILVLIPGQTQGQPQEKALMLAAHYDSAYPSPGAADNAASVGAILEAMRALKSGAPLKNDLIVLLTDGEEAGLLGAKLFIEHHPWAKKVGLALNFEYRGNTGPIWMFETSAGNANLVSGWLRSTPRPLGNSLLYEIYRHMPNATDASIFKTAGLPVLNFAAGEGYTDYHTELDRADRLDPSTLQHQGDTMLALARHFGNMSLNGLVGSNSVYFDVPGIGVVHYSEELTRAFGLGLLALAVTMAVLAVRSGQARTLALVGGIPVFALTGVVVVAASQLLWYLVTLAHPQYRLLLHGSTYNAGWYLGAALALSVALFALIQRLLEKWFRRLELAGGALLAITLGALASTLWVPGGSFVFLWPTAPFLLAIGFLCTRRGRAVSANTRLALLLAASAPGLILLAPVIHFAYYALTPSMIAAAIAIVALQLGNLSLLLSAIGGRFRLPVLALTAAIGCLVAGAMTANFDPHRPAPSNLTYIQEDITGQGHWKSNDELLNPWTRQFFGATPGKTAFKELYGPRTVPVWMKDTAPLVQGIPSIAVLKDTRENGERTISLDVHSPRKAPRLSVAVSGIVVKRGMVGGQPFGKRNERGWHVDSYGLLDQHILIDLVVPENKAFQVFATDLSYGIPAHSYGPRPPGIINQPFRDSETTRLISKASFEP